MNKQVTSIVLILSSIAMFMLLAVVDLPHASDKFFALFIGLSSLTCGIIALNDKN